MRPIGERMPTITRHRSRAKHESPAPTRPNVPSGFKVERLVVREDLELPGDVTFLRRRDRGASGAEARVLRGLWGHIHGSMLLKVKEPGQRMRRGELLELVAFACLHAAQAEGRAPHLTLGLVVAKVTPDLREAIRVIGG